MQHAGSRVATHIPSYISGYFDGEGCFSVAIAPRSRLAIGWDVRPSVSVSQNEDRAEVLAEIAEYFQCGTFRPDRSDRTIKWEVRSLRLLRERVLPHFVEYPLRSGKQRDVKLLSMVCESMALGEHLQLPGLHNIVELVSRMNPSGIRRYSPGTILASLGEMKA
jgi:LAGLIDADG endonuclease